MWYMHHLNGWELLGLEPGALSVQRSAGECALLSFFRKLILIYFSVQIEIIGEFEQHKYTGRNGFRKLFLNSLLLRKLVVETSYHCVGMSELPGTPKRIMCLHSSHVGAKFSMIGEKIN